MRSGVGVPPPSMPVLPPPMGPQVPSVLGMPSQLQSLPPPPPPSAPGSSGYLRKRKPGDGGDLPLSGMSLPAGARARQKINISHEELEARKKLSNIRVVQKNLVYVTNISLDFLNKGSANLDIPPGEFLSRNEYFGQYGEIFKLVVNLSGIYNANSSHGPTVSCYVTYRRNDDATACITAVNGAWLGGKLLRASNGTTKYCTYFLRGLTCSNVDCLYLHELGHDKDSFTKESMAADKNLFSESVHPKISFTERGENVLPPVHSNHMLDMSTLVIYERAATLFPPKYSDVLARSSNYIIITSPSKIITVFLSPASGSGASLGSLPPSSSSSSGSSNVSGTGMGPIAGTVSGLIQQSSVGSGSASSLSAMGTGAIPQGLSSPLISSTVPQHQPYGSHHHNRLQSHSPVSPPSSPKKGYGHVGSGAQMLSAYDGRSSMLFTEDSDEFPPLSPVTDTKGVKKERRSDGTVNDGTRTLAGTSVAGDTTNEHDNIGNRFGGDNNNNNNNNSSGSGNNNNNNNNNVSDNNNSSSNAQDKKTDEGMMDDDDNDNNKDNNDNDKEDERLRQERRKWRKKMWDFEVSKLGEEERALSDVIRSLDDEFEDSPALIRRVRGEDEDEFGGNPLLCALPPLDNISFNGSDQDQLASLICAAPGTLSTTTVAGSSVASDGDSIFSYGPVGFGPEYTAGLFPKLFGDSGSGSGSGNGNGYSGCVMPENSQNCVVRSSEDSYYYSEESRLSTVSGAESEEIMDDNRLVIMPSNLDDRFAEAALLSSADEERGLVGGGSSSNGDYGEEEEEDDDNDECDEYDDDNEYDEEEDDEEEEEKPRPRVLPRCSCCGGLILSSSPRVDTKKKGNNNNDSGDNNNNGDNNINNINNNNNNNNGNDNDDDDDDVPPELVNPSASEESVDSDDDDDNGSGLASPKSSSECSKSGKNSVLPSILDGDASVSASDHVAIHIPNSTILICPLYSRSSNRK